MTPLPEDLERWIAAHFPAGEVYMARELLQLRYLVGLLQIDYRDVIMFGEYEVVDGKLTRVRNLSEPLL